MAPPAGSRDRAGTRRRTVSGTSPSSASASASAPRIPKLRDSCDACAAAKVRCTKKKPACTRCEKRGLHCQYMATRRAGRPSQSSTKSKPSPDHDPERISASNNVVDVPSPSSPCETTPLQSPLQSPSRMDSELEFDFSPGQQHPPPYPETSILTALGVELNDLVSSLGSFPGLETPMGAQDLLSQLNFLDPESITMDMDCSDTMALMPEDPFALTEETYSDMQSLDPTPPLLPSGLPSITGTGTGTGTSYAESDPSPRADPPCRCRLTAHGFLQGLFPGASEACGQLDRGRADAPGSPFPAIRTVIAENERMVEAMDNILQCPCSHDGYLLALLSLVVFKLLDRYATAARAARLDRSYNHNHNNHNVSHPSSYPARKRSPTGGVGVDVDVDGEDSARVAAQMVLSELHHAQRLVNQLSARFKGPQVARAGGTRVEDGASSGGGITGAAVGTLYDGERSSWPFSTAVLDQLEADLRRRLRTVSSKLVDMLRRG